MLLQGRSENLSQANKLSRTYTTLLEALNRHRGKGQQKVTVEHVHVHAGGQAVVGTVETQGGGDIRKSEDQPHARQIAHALQPAVWSEDQARELRASRRRHRRAAAGCTAGCPRAHRRVIAMPSSMDATRAEAIANRRHLTALLRGMRALANSKGEVD